MKTSLLLGLATLAAIAASNPLVAESTKANQAIAHRVNAVEHFGAAAVMRGTSRVDVRLTLGAPQRKIGENTWVYAGFSAGGAQAREDDSGLLLLTFQQGRVSDIQLVNGRAEKLIAARTETLKNAGTLVVVAKP